MVIGRLHRDDPREHQRATLTRDQELRFFANRHRRRGTVREAAQNGDNRDKSITLRFAPSSGHHAWGTPKAFRLDGISHPV